MRITLLNNETRSLEHNTSKTIDAESLRATLLDLDSKASFDIKGDVITVKSDTIKPQQLADILTPPESKENIEAAEQSAFDARVAAALTRLGVVIPKR